MKIYIIITLVSFVVLSELQQVLSLTRHGARYPINFLFDGGDEFGMWG
jgi:hypothetical protein